MRLATSLLLLSLAPAALVPLTLSAQDRPLPNRSQDTILMAEIRVVGTRDALASIPGSAFLIDRQSLTNAHVFTINEALRRVPGVTTRDEEGFGLRPNIGIRGLNPTRSSKVLLLEDGLPITFAPYGANETYYHPPVDRFERIEVLKGSGQILFGPQTIGGVINYITPDVPRRPGGTVSITPGSQHYLNGQVRYGGSWGRAGFVASYVRKQGDGARENIGSRLNDLNLKGVFALGASHALTVRGGYYAERSNVTYSGLTEAEYAADPRQNPFRSDSMILDRWGASATHQVSLSPAVALTTSLYGFAVSRDWWRQSSNSEQRPNDRSDPACGGMQNLNTTCGNQGRLRDYFVWGVEPRLHATSSLFGAVAVTDLGVRAHFERQDRRQVNGATPNAREAGPSTDANSGLAEDNLRKNQAYSAFVQNRLLFGRWTVTPGLRVEHVRYQRNNRLPTTDVSGRTDLTQLIPGLGATFTPAAHVTVFAGAHRGFAPPRTEDVIDNTTGVAVELDPELSWNYELGVRAQPVAGVALEGTLFRMDFENQIVAASVAGGAGASLTNAGQTLHQGLELSARLDSDVLTHSAHNLFFQAAWTYLPTARFDGARFAYVGTGGSDVVGKVYAGQNAAGTRTQVSVSGNRLPYAPRATLSVTAGYAHRGGVDLRLEAVRVGTQFGDALNTTTTVPDGQQGVIRAYTVWNAAASYRLRVTRTTVFATVKNLLDETYVVDRTRGLLPGSPRLVQAGIQQEL